MDKFPPCQALERFRRLGGGAGKMPADLPWVSLFDLDLAGVETAMQFLRICRWWVLGGCGLLVIGVAAKEAAAQVNGPEAAARLPFQIVQAGAEVGPRVAANESGEKIRQAKPLPLAPPKHAAGPSAARPGDKLSARPPLVTVATSLAVVLGLFGLLVWFTRRSGRRFNGGLPSDVVETLGRAPLNKQQEMHLVRIGNKLLLLAVTANSAETLTEITDLQEIARLTCLCQQGQSGHLSDSFRQMLSHLNRGAEAERSIATARF